MAKKDDQPSIKVEPRPTNGKRNGFLAEEKHLDRRGLLRLGTWGLVAVGAVAVAVFANESSMKLQRDEAAALELARQSQQVQALVKENKNETRRLASAIDTLNGDRDRLFARITVLEEGLDSVTGSIGRQSSAKTAPQPPALPATAAAVLAPPSPTPAAPPSQPVAENPAPAPTTEVAPVASTAPTPPIPEKPVADAKIDIKADAKPAEPHPAKQAATEAPKPPSASQPVASSAPPSPQPASTVAPVPVRESKSMIGPPESAAQKPMKQPPASAKAVTAPAPQLAALATAEEKQKKAPEPVELASAEIAVKRTEFGVDLGGANSVPGLRALWRSLLKTRATASLTTLRPIIVIKESTNGLGMQLRLVAGPFDDAAAAAKICADMGERPCETTVYDGQRLMLKPGEEPAVAAVEPVKAEPEKSVSARSAAERPEATRAEPAMPEKAVRRNYLRHRFYAKKLPAPPPLPPAPAPAAAQEAPKPEPTTFSSFFNRHTQPQPPAVANGS
jgi:hypothetical protein